MLTRGGNSEPIKIKGSKLTSDDEQMFVCSGKRGFIGIKIVIRETSKASPSLYLLLS